MAKYLDYAGLQELVSKLKSYVDGAVSAFDLFIVVASLPTSGIQTNKIYLVPDPNAEQDNAYDEYAYVDGKWELLGKVVLDTDLSNYYTKEETDGLLDAKQDKLTAGDNVTISGSTISVTVPTKVSELTNDSGYVTETDLETDLASKQDVLTAGDYILIQDNIISADLTPITTDEVDALFD